MVKGIIGYKALSYKDVEPILMKLRSYAMQYPGFINAENLVSEKDHSVVVMTSTWETIGDWRTWMGSRETRDLLRQARAAVMGAPRIAAYMIMPTVEWR